MLRAKLGAAVVGLAAVLSAVPGECVAADATYQRFYAAGADPGAMVRGPDGALWFAWENGLGRVALDGSVRLHRIADVDPETLTVGPDRALWFVDPLRHRVGRFTLDGSVSLIPVRDGTDGRLGGIATGPDGTLWIANLDAGTIERLALDGTATVAARLPNDAEGEDPEPWAILPGADGEVWFGGADLGIGRLTPQGEVRILHPKGIVTHVAGLAAAPDGTVWAQEWLGGSVTHLGPGGVLARVRVELPSGIAVEADGSPWFGHPRGITRLDQATGRRRFFGDPFGEASDCGRYESQFVFPTGMAFSRDGALWATDSGNGSLLRVGPAGRAQSPLSAVLPSRRAVRQPHDLVSGRGGRVWVAADRALVELRPHRRPRVYPVEGRVGALALGPNGRPWFSRDATIAELTAGGSVRTLARLPSTAIVTAMTRGRDGAIWFTDFGRRRVGRVGRAGTARYITDRLGRRARPRDITLGPDRALWVTDSSGAIFRVRPSGRVRRFPVRRGVTPVGITQGPDGAVWFTEFSGRRVARIAPNGRVTEFKVGDRPIAIAAGRDGALWVTTTGVSGDNGLVRITTRGQIKSFYVRRACDGAVQGLLSAPDGSLYFTEANGPVAVGRLDVRRLKRTGQLTAG